jgi:hypothetical protein
MADGGQVLGWGLWNERLTEWFNPGTRKPYYPSREAAERMIPLARRQYSMGTWELREYRLEDDETGAADEADATSEQSGR